MAAVAPILLGQWVTSVGFRGDGGQLLATDLHRYSRLFDIRPGDAPGWQLDTGAAAITAAFTSQDAEIVTISEAGEVTLWDAQSGKRRRTLRPPGLELQRIGLDAPVGHAVVADTNHTVPF